MVGTLDLLPLLEGWDWIRLTGEKPLEASDTPVALYESEEDEMGWLVSARMSSTVADASLTIEYDPVGSGQVLRFALNPEALYRAGYYYASSLPYVSDYDPTNSSYGAEFRPSPPLGLKGRLTITASPGSGDGTLRYDVLMAIISDAEAFYNSLKAVLGPQIIQQVAPAQQPAAPKAGLPAVRRPYQGFLP